jgi:6-pyruvoyl tetrahydropterin synthase/QueD family protein
MIYLYTFETDNSKLMNIYKQFTFDAAHFLPKVPEGHKCKAMHGHTYHVTVFVSGPVLEEAGWVIDFSEVKTVCKTGWKILQRKMWFVGYGSS